MKCSLCDSLALRMVGRKGFCRDHKAEAWAAEADKLGVDVVRVRTDFQREVDARMKELEEA